MNPLVANPFSNALPATSSVMDIVAARESSEVQAMVAVAKRFPRDPVHAMDRILQACARPSLAESSLYQYSRGGSDISGPSIRLAEAIAQSWGNLQFGFRELSRGVHEKVGYSDVEAYAWELETNTRKPITFRVKHWRDTRKGGYALTDERDIYELVANQASRRVRNCILALIPGDVTEAAQRQCEVTLNTHAEISDESIKKMVDAFSGFNVTRQQLEARIQRRLDASTLTPALMVQLKKIYASLRDGMSSPADWFVAETPEEEATPAPSSSLSRTEQAKSRLLAQQHRAKIVESLEIAGAMPPPDVDLETGEIREPDHLDLIQAILNCQSKEEMERYRAAVAALKGDEKRQAVNAWKAQEAEIAPVEAV